MSLSLLFSTDRFPLAHKDLLLKWLSAMKRDKWTPTSNEYICSEHFEEQCFSVYPSSVRLREDAVPTLFTFPDHLQKKPSHRRVFVRHADCDSASSAGAGTSAVDEPPTSSGTVDSVKNHHSYALPSPRALKRKYEQVAGRHQHQHAVATAKLKKLRRQLFRCKARLQTMQDVVRVSE